MLRGDLYRLATDTFIEHRSYCPSLCVWFPERSTTPPESAHALGQ